MLKKLASDHLDNDVKLKHERAFIRKLKVWHQADMLQNGFALQRIDQLTMKFKKKRVQDKYAE